MIELERIETAYRQLRAEVDAWFQQGREQFGDRLLCRQGCTACCAGLFDISLLDAWVLARERHRLPASVRQQAATVVERVMAALGRSGRVPVLGVECPPDQWPAEADLLCPLLDAQGRCRLYQARPLACRLHGLPQVDWDGTVVMEDHCGVTTTGEEVETDPWRGPFRQWLFEEARLARLFNRLLTGEETLELDTFIAAALALDFGRWRPEIGVLLPAAPEEGRGE